MSILLIDPADAPIGSRWRGTDGHVYRVEGFGLIAATSVLVVICVCESGGWRLSRILSFDEFLDGRFARIEEGK